MAIELAKDSQFWIVEKADATTTLVQCLALVAGTAKRVAFLGEGFDTPDQEFEQSEKLQLGDITLYAEGDIKLGEMTLSIYWDPKDTGGQNVIRTMFTDRTEKKALIHGADDTFEIFEFRVSKMSGTKRKIGDFIAQDFTLKQLSETSVVIA